MAVHCRQDIEMVLDTILKIAEIISADASELLSAVIDTNPKFHKLYQMYKQVLDSQNKNPILSSLPSLLTNQVLLKI